jgi:gliding-associated putative ABC transporter substrate-binding component GldG
MLFLFNKMIKHLKRFGAFYLIGIGVLLIALSPFVRGRFDLSEDGKYTLSESSEVILESIDAPVKVQVYLGGDDLPGGFKRLRKETLDLLADMKSVSSSNIEIQVIDVYEEYPTEEARASLTRTLDSLGIPPTNLVSKDNGKQVQQLIFPGLVISKGALKKGVLLLKGNKLASPEEIINQSIEGLEFEIVQAIQTLLPQERKKIGFFVEYSATLAIAQIDLINSLKRKYDLFPVDLAASPTLDGLDGICVLQPTREFSESDAYKIDQFIVKGGKAIFLVDGVKVDTLETQGLAISPRKTGLENILFHYGLRINANLVKDAQLSGMIPLNVGNLGNKPNIQLMPWPAFPLLNGNPQHIITKNLDAIYGRFVSTIDTISGVALHKTALLKTSQYTQVAKAPSLLSFSSAGKDFDPSAYTAGVQTAAYLVEGKFESAFQHLTQDTSFVASGKSATAIILISDGDVAVNGVDYQAKQAMPLGFDPFMKNTFANKDFILNAFTYLLDDNSPLLARSKSIKLRPLDKAKIQADGTFYQVLNIAVPLLFASLLSIVVVFYRKRKYNC